MSNNSKRKEKYSYHANSFKSKQYSAEEQREVGQFSSWNLALQSGYILEYIVEDDGEACDGYHVGDRGERRQVL